MKTVELIGDVDAERRLSAEVPEDVPPGPVRLLLLVPEEDQTEEMWMRGIASAWSEDLADARQDLYTLEDGQAPDEAG